VNSACITLAFFDPGSAITKHGSRKRRAVLEMRQPRSTVILEDGQAIGRLVYGRSRKRRTFSMGRRQRKLSGQGLSCRSTAGVSQNADVMLVTAAVLVILTLLRRLAVRWAQVVTKPLAKHEDDMADALNVLSICGSLRKGSYNAALARALPALAPPT